MWLRCALYTSYLSLTLTVRPHLCTFKSGDAQGNVDSCWSVMLGGTFLLTALLSPKLAAEAKKGNRCRVVDVSSGGMVGVVSSGLISRFHPTLTQLTQPHSTPTKPSTRPRSIRATSSQESPIRLDFAATATTRWPSARRSC